MSKYYRKDWLALKATPTVIVTKEMKKKIDWLHAMVGDKEWSGELITREKGSIADANNWKIYAEDIFLTDIGTGAFTGYEVEKGAWKAADIMALYEAFPGLETGELKNHHIHTHHSMGAFFSGTDNDNLEERGMLSNYFMMLIVDFREKYVAKVAFPCEYNSNEESDITLKFNSIQAPPMKIKDSRKREILCTMDCEIVIERDANDNMASFIERYNSVVESLKKEKASSYDRFSTSEPYKRTSYSPGAYASKVSSQSLPFDDIYEKDVDYYGNPITSQKSNYDFPYYGSSSSKKDYCSGKVYCEDDTKGDLKKDNTISGSIYGKWASSMKYHSLNDVLTFLQDTIECEFIDYGDGIVTLSNNLEDLAANLKRTLNKMRKKKDQETFIENVSEAICNVYPDLFSEWSENVPEAQIEMYEFCKKFVNSCCGIQNKPIIDGIVKAFDGMIEIVREYYNESMR